MTLTEASKQGISWLRRLEWNPSAKMRIDLVSGGHGPWGHLYNPEYKTPTPQRFLLIGSIDDGWIATEPPEGEKP